MTVKVGEMLKIISCVGAGGCVVLMEEKKRERKRKKDSAVRKPQARRPPQPLHQLNSLRGTCRLRFAHTYAYSCCRCMLGSPHSLDFTISLTIGSI